MRSAALTDTTLFFTAACSSGEMRFTPLATWMELSETPRRFAASATEIWEFPRFALATLELSPIAYSRFHTRAEMAPHHIRIPDKGGGLFSVPTKISNCGLAPTARQRQYRFRPSRIGELRRGQRIVLRGGNFLDEQVVALLRDKAGLTDGMSASVAPLAYLKRKSPRIKEDLFRMAELTEELPNGQFVRTSVDELLERGPIQNFAQE